MNEIFYANYVFVGFNSIHERGLLCFSIWQLVTARWFIAFLSSTAFSLLFHFTTHFCWIWYALEHNWYDRCLKRLFLFCNNIFYLDISLLHYKFLATLNLWKTFCKFSGKPEEFERGITIYLYTWKCKATKTSRKID